MRLSLIKKIRSYSQRLSSEKMAEQDRDSSFIAAVLMIAIAQQDDVVQKSELHEIRDVLTSHYDVSVDKANALIKKATETFKDTHDFYQFTKQLIAEKTQDERIEVIYQLWCIALSDGHIDSDEEHLIRKIAELTGVHHHQFINSKIRAKKEHTRSEKARISKPRNR